MARLINTVTRKRRRRPSPGRILLGDKELDEFLSRFSVKTANRIARLALGRSTRAIAKGIRQQVPSRFKGIRKAIGSKVGSGRGRGRRGVLRARAGAAVGKKEANVDRKAQGGTKTTGRGKKKRTTRRAGVGIGARNIHWWIMGATGDTPRKGQKGPPRKTTKGVSRGIMPPQKPIVKLGYQASQSAAEAALREGVIEGMNREVLKGNR